MNPMTKLGMSVLGVAVALGVLGDALLRVTPWGINVGVWVGVLVGLLVGLAQWRGVALTGGGRWLLLPAFAFAVLYAWHDSPTLNALNLMALLIALAIAALRSRQGRIRIAGVMDYVRAQIAAAYHAMLGAFPLLASDIQWKRIPHGGWSKQAVAVARGLIIGVPLLMIFGGLFIAADAVFEDFALRLFDWDIEALLTSVVFITAWAWISAGFLRQTLIASSDPTGLQDLSSLKAPSGLVLGPIEIGTALGLLNALFFAFVLVQMRYFFGGVDVVESSIDLTYAEYARRGFFELVTVAALVLPTLLIAHWLLPRDHPSAERVFRPLAGALIVTLFVIMVSAVQRMLLYQREFGLTELRVYTTAFMGWLAIVFVWFALTVLRGQRERFAFGALAAGFALIVALHVLNPGDLIVRVNVNRVDAPRPLDARYLAQLSADAVPVLIDALPSMRDADRCIVAARLLARWTSPAHPDWRTWNVSRVQAWRMVGANREALQAWACPVR